jgi:mono/diheme cytochrome c family protein
MMVVGTLIPGCFLCADFKMPDAPFPKIKASSDPAVIAQGAYIAHHVAHCSSCHAPPEAMERKGELKLAPGKDPVSGGYVFKAGPFGTYVASNLTPDKETGIGNYTDEELARVIRHGVKRDNVFAPFMRLAVGPMADEDLVAVISWLRTQKPVKNQVQAEEFGLIAKLLNGKFKWNDAQAPPYVAPGEISVKRGNYLADGPGMCMGCHTAADPMEGFAFVGEPYSGAAEPEPDPTDESKVIIAPNLTPDEKTGHIAKWDEDAFVARFKAGRVIKGSKMPWEAFKGMTENDMRSIYRYLKSLKPVENDVGKTWREKD